MGGAGNCVLFPNTITYSLRPMEGWRWRADELGLAPPFTTHPLPHGPDPTSASEQRSPPQYVLGLRCDLQKKQHHPHPFRLAGSASFESSRHLSLLATPFLSHCLPSINRPWPVSTLKTVALWPIARCDPQVQQLPGPSPRFRQSSTLAFPCSSLSAAGPSACPTLQEKL
jgi:hypothetical protein